MKVLFFGRGNRKFNSFYLRVIFLIDCIFSHIFRFPPQPNPLEPTFRPSTSVSFIESIETCQ